MSHLLRPLFLALLTLAAPACADWRTDADARIEQHRKADVTVRVVDADGRPVPDAEVALTHRRHAFPFGTVVTAAYLGITEEQFRGMTPEMREHRLWRDMASWENVERYRDVIADHYTEVVFENAMKKEPWAVIGGRSSGETDAAWRGEWNLAALRWCRDRGIAVRGHVGTWCWNMDSRFSNFTEEAGDDWPLHHLLWQEHLAGQNAFYGDGIGEWDVLNHPVTVPEKSLLNKPGGLDFYRDQLVLSRQTAPHADRYTNEHLVLAGGHELERYEKLIADLAAADAPLDCIGFQAHFNWTNGDFRKRPTMDVVHERLDRFAAFGKKLKFTELERHLDRTRSGETRGRAGGLPHRPGARRLLPPWRGRHRAVGPLGAAAREGGASECRLLRTALLRGAP